MSSNPSSGKVEVVEVARAKAEYLRAEVYAEFKRLDSAPTQLTPQAVMLFERKWADELKVLEDRVFAATLSPAAQPYLAELEALLAEMQSFVKQYADALRYHYQPAGAAAAPETAEDEKERLRAERKARMEKFQRGEKPD